MNPAGTKVDSAFDLSSPGPRSGFLLPGNMLRPAQGVTLKRAPADRLDFGGRHLLTLLDEAIKRSHRAYTVLTGLPEDSNQISVFCLEPTTTSIIYPPTPFRLGFHTQLILVWIIFPIN